MDFQKNIRGKKKSSGSFLGKKKAKNWENNEDEP